MLTQRGCAIIRVFGILFTVSICVDRSFGDYIDLYDHLFAKYRKEVRPVRYPSAGPTNISVQLFMKQIQKVEESDQKLTLYCWLEMYWTDEQLHWDPTQFNNTAQIIVPAHSIWKPDLLVYNSAHMNIADNEMETNALIDSTGAVSVYRAIIAQITCDLHMERFPFDQQICFIMLSSWSYDGAGIMLDTVVPTETDNKAGDLTQVSMLKHYMPSAEWALNDFKVRGHLKYYECCVHPYPDLTYYFSIRRNPVYYLFTQLIPSTFITVVTIIGSFTPHSSTGENQEKISLGVTALLSLAIILMMVADKLPATSDNLPLLGKFYVGLIFIMFAATCCTTITLSTQMRGNTGERLGKRMKKFMLTRFGRIFFDRIREFENEDDDIEYRHYRYLLAHRRPEQSCSSTNEKNNHELAKETSIDHSPKTSTTTTFASIAGGDDENNHNAPPMFNEAFNRRLLSTIEETREATLYMRRQVFERLHNDRCRREWMIVGRGLDRLFMCSFIFLTFAYSLVLFVYGSESTMMITEEFLTKAR